MGQADKRGAVIGGNFIHILHGFAMGLENGDFPSFGMGDHELAQRFTGQDVLANLFGHFNRGPDDAFAGNINLF